MKQDFQGVAETFLARLLKERFKLDVGTCYFYLREISHFVNVGVVTYILYENLSFYLIEESR